MPKKIKTEKIKTILPSKKFIYIISICVGSCILIVVFASFFGSKSDFSSPLISVSGDTTVGDLLSLDSNNNGISDWEESLFGLNPKGDGIANKKIITEKRQKMREDSGLKKDSIDSNTPTAKLAGGIMSTLLALQQSGNLTPETAANIGRTLGDSVDGQRDNPHRYSINDITTIDDSSDQVMVSLATNVQKLMDEGKAAGLGAELPEIYKILNQNSGDTQITSLDSYSAAYANFSAGLMKMKVPKVSAQRFITLANSCDLMANALKKIELTYTDSVNGLIGYDEYTKVAKNLDSDFLNLLNIGPDTTTP